MNSPKRNPTTNSNSSFGYTCDVLGDERGAEAVGVSAPNLIHLSTRTVKQNDGCCPLTEIAHGNLNREQVAELVAGVDVSTLPFVRHRQGIKTLPQASAVYFLIVGHEVLYIGQSSQLRTRWLLHEHRNIAEQQNAKIAYMVLPSSRSLRQNIEAGLIQKFRPRLNKRCAPFSHRVDVSRVSEERTLSLRPAGAWSEWDANGIRCRHDGLGWEFDFWPGDYQEHLKWADEAVRQYGSLRAGIEDFLANRTQAI